MPQSAWLDSTQKSVWREKLDRFPVSQRDVYFLPEYLELYEDRETRFASCFFYEEEGALWMHSFILRQIEGGLSDIESAYGYAGPLTTSQDPGFLDRAFAAFRAQAIQKGAIAELIKFHPILQNQNAVGPGFPGKLLEISRTVAVDLSIDEKLRWEKIYPHANRKNINKAGRAGIQIEFTQSDEAWDSFRTLYAATMDANHASEFYYFNDSYFRNIRDHLAENYVLAAARLNGELVSVLIVLLGPILAHCHLIGTRRDGMNLGGNNLLHHELISWARARGLSQLHIGGGRTPAPDDSLLRFKMNFSEKLPSFWIGENLLDREAYDRLCREWLERNPGKELSSRFLKYRC